MLLTCMWQCGKLSKDNCSIRWDVGGCRGGCRNCSLYTILQGLCVDKHETINLLVLCLWAKALAKGTSGRGKKRWGEGVEGLNLTLF